MMLSFHNPPLKVGLDLDEYQQMVQETPVLQLGSSVNFSPIASATAFSSATLPYGDGNNEKSAPAYESVYQALARSIHRKMPMK